ncbi:MAG: hypothetical protein KF692_01895 [Cryobacterium sp.]|nr:hypothetical protein [Cryobacterium sp.]
MAAKSLSQVEADSQVSNQHEFNGAGPLVALFGTSEPRKEIQAQHIDMEHLGADPKFITLTWYDARVRHPTRSEWRMYYPRELAASLHPGGVLVLASRGELTYCFTAGAGTLGAFHLHRLFGLGSLDTRFHAFGVDELDSSVLAAAEQLIMASLGIVTDQQKPLEEHFFDTFGLVFPTGEVLSRFVRENTFGVDAVADPDEALVAWMRVEYDLFSAMEAVVESDAMDAALDLDAKLKIAMRVFQRRKSRAGKAMEYHLRALFDANEVTYSANPITEGREEPDFIFPSIDAYRDESFDPALLTMLGSKQTLRDRWRQVLQEAARVPRKHLVTIDQDISANQAKEIDSAGIQLVLPRDLHSGYADEISETFWSISELVAHTKTCQAAAGSAAGQLF